MFWQSYKNTLKNLIRTPLFWVLVALVFLNTLYFALKGYVSYYDASLGELIPDTDPRFVLTYTNYLQLCLNVIRGGIMTYTVPCLAVVSTMLILNRDFGDSFFEIERAGGVKPGQYFGGRLAALASVNMAVALTASFWGVHWYYFTRGGIFGMSLWRYWTDSTVRILRIFFFAAVPVILLYIGLTYLVGSLAGSGLWGAVAGIGCVFLFCMLTTLLSFRMSSVFELCNTLSEKLYFHWTVSDLDAVRWRQLYELPRESVDFAGYEVLIWTVVMAGAAAAFLAGSYLKTKKREI